MLKKIKKKFSFLNYQEKIIIVTAHRRENYGKGIKNICSALKEIAKKNKKLQIIYPVHLNPKVAKVVQKYLSKVSNIFLLKPLDYFSFIYLMKVSYLVLTDSGGIQEEAPTFKKPVLVLRNETERPEAKNLIGIYSSLTNSSLEKSINDFSGKNFSEFKENLSEVVSDKISPISAEIKRLLNEKNYLDEILLNGCKKANEITSLKIKKIHEIVGF